MRSYLRWRVQILACFTTIISDNISNRFHYLINVIESFANINASVMFSMLHSSQMQRLAAGTTLHHYLKLFLTNDFTEKPLYNDDSKNFNSAKHIQKSANRIEVVTMKEVLNKNYLIYVHWPFQLSHFNHSETTRICISSVQQSSSIRTYY